MKFKGQKKRELQDDVQKVPSIFYLLSIGKNKKGENFWIEIKGNIDGHVPSNFSVKSGSKGVQPKINIVAKENLFFYSLASPRLLYLLSLSAGNPILFILVCEFSVSCTLFLFTFAFLLFFSHFVASGAVEFVSK